MTRTTNARLAGSMFLLYIGVGITSMVLFNHATGAGEGAAAKLASLAEHATTVRATVVLEMAVFVIALALAVALYALTRDVDRDLALLALCCRVTEGALAPVGAVRTLGLLSVATTATTATGADVATATALGAALLRQGGSASTVAATCFAAGSTLFCYLFLRARSIPAPLAWLGVLASVLLVVALPAQLLGFVQGLAAWLMWLPMLVFEVVLALWLLIRGVAAPVHPHSG